MQKAVGFQCRYPELLCLFPQVGEYLCVDDGSWFYFDSESRKRRYVISEKKRLCGLMHALGYTQQLTEAGDIWRFKDPITQQTYLHSIQLGRALTEMPSEIQQFWQQATVFFNDMVISETVLQFCPQIQHFVNEGTNHYRPNPVEDAEQYPDFNLLTTFVWNNPSRFRNYTAIHHARHFRYEGLHRAPFITREHVLKTVKLTPHANLEQMYAYYEPLRGAVSDSESDGGEEGADQPK